MPALSGDVTSSAGSTATTVAKLQGVSVSNSAPSSGQVLTYNGSAWAPAAATGGVAVHTPGDVNFSIPASGGFVIYPATTVKTLTLPSAAAAGAGKIIYYYVTVNNGVPGGAYVKTSPGDTLMDYNGSVKTSAQTAGPFYTATFISGGGTTWYQITQ
jgi:hypothetical protein